MFIPVRPHPLSRVGITPFVLETYRDAVIGVTPQFFHQVIVQFFGSFATEKSFDRLSTRQELRPVAPLRIRGLQRGGSAGGGRCRWWWKCKGESETLWP